MSATVIERGEARLLATYARYPVVPVSGRGCRVVAADGREYLDFIAGIAVSALGHGHPALVAALREAAGGLWHVSNLYWSEPMVALAERLTEAAGMQRAFFCNSGTEAVEAAIKLARKARPGREAILVFEGSFHGRTLGALSATAQPRYQEPFRPLLPGFAAVPFGDLEAARAAIGPATAAVIVEPVQGEGGIRPAPAGFLHGLRRLCDESGALLLFDEVQSGLGRTGRFLACQEEGVLPDAVALAKGLAGGLPMGALLARGSAAAAFEPGDHGCTFGGGPLVSRVAGAVLDVVLEEGFLESVRARGERLHRGLAALATRHARVVEARGRGLMQGLVLDGPWAGELNEALLAQGLLAAPAGKEVLRLVPPLIVGEQEIDEGLGRIDAALRAAAPRAVASAGG